MIMYIILAAYVVMMLAVGFAGAKKAKNLTAFTVGGRKAGAWFSAFAYGTTYFSAVIFIGYAGRNGYDYSLWSVLIGAGNVFIGAWLAWRVLARRTRVMTKRYEIKTMPDFFAKRYISPGLRTFAAVVIFIFMIPYSASVYSGLSYLFESVFNIPYEYAILGMAVLSAIYLVLGGYMATLLGDFIQGLIMLAGIVVMIAFLLHAPGVGGPAVMLERTFEAASEVKLLDFAQPLNLISLLSLVFMTSFGTWGLPQMVHKFYAIESDDAVRRGTVISTIFCGVVSCGAYFAGSMARTFFTCGAADTSRVLTENGVRYDAVMPEFLRQALPPAVLAVIVVLVFAASISTLTGIVLTSSTSMSLDLIKSVFVKNMSEKKAFLLTRCLCLVFIAASVVIALVKTPIQSLMSFSWGVVAGSFLAPFLLGLYCRSVTKAGAWAGVAGGFAVSAGSMVFTGFDASLSPVFAVIAMATSFVMTLAVSAFTRKFDSSFVAEIMACEDGTADKNKKEKVLAAHEPAAAVKAKA